MSEPQRFEGPLWKEGDNNPAVVVGIIENIPGTGHWRGEITSFLGDLYLQRIMFSPADWYLTPDSSIPLRINFNLAHGGLAFEGQVIRP